MSAISFAKQAFGREKPHSSITDWIEILTASNVAEEAYYGIPELVDSINLQPHAGPAETSRALRKKLKHGSAHQQYRALAILNALVENCGDKFKSSFADGQLTDSIKHLASDGTTDARVKKKLLLVLKSWHEQFKNDPSMSIFSSLYLQVVRDRPRQFEGAVDPEAQKNKLVEAQRRAQEKQDAKSRARQEEEKRKQEKQRKKDRLKRAPFNFEQERPKVLASIVEASQASSNLVNAITLVNTERDDLHTNIRVQECLEKAKLTRKPIVRYIQLVENEELIGTLIETNERIINAFEMYDSASGARASKPPPPEPAEAAAEGLANVRLTGDSEVSRLQEKQRAAVARANGSGRTDNAFYSDLQDIDFLGSSSNNLPPPIRPSTFADHASQPRVSRGSLSDFSDYESSDEETHSNYQGGKRDYINVSDDEDIRAGPNAQSKATHDDDNPFADPFRD